MGEARGVPPREAGRDRREVDEDRARDPAAGEVPLDRGAGEAPRDLRYEDEPDRLTADPLLLRREDDLEEDDFLLLASTRDLERDLLSTGVRARPAGELPRELLPPRP